jgi:hypothetical protein
VAAIFRVSAAGRLAPLVPASRRQLPCSALAGAGKLCSSSGSGVPSMRSCRSSALRCAVRVLPSSLSQ